MDEDKNFCDEFQRTYNNSIIVEADDYTPEVDNDTYWNMEVVLPWADNGFTFPKVTKKLRDANSIPIVTANDNPIIDTRQYEVECIDGYRVSLSVNTIATNMFA